MNKFFAACTFSLWVSIGMAQVQSPDAFLGYRVGSRFTPHHKLVSYFYYIAQQVPGMVKTEQYGLTNEGRPLIVSYISSPANMQQLEAIRKNNLRLANLSKDKMAADESAPAIVWLSYNVHGNEASSSEAAMLTLYALAGTSNTATKGWLQNTVVIMDPCVNPDGRDRYVNWFNATAGKNFNPDLQSREHREPWPGGRTNHYNFDLNRDWVWQTQLETRQRLKLYHQWLPQVHVDYHEQGVDEPYYFAPAAQPYHQVIGQWQKDFQLMIGKNHAKYFDANGWLYFTKEVFDLYYPAYGDTYPLYNGAIGMTYEQGGGPRGGVGVVTAEGDTLTLTDRAMHHHTTALSTLETASLHASRLVKEFHQFYNQAVSTGAGEYNTYIIKHDSLNGQKISTLLSLLENNHISFGSGQTAPARGFNYSTGKEESFTIQPADLIISTAQPHAAMVRVLFEPRSVLVDSNTYDITAWALPYVFGLKAYATAARITALKRAVAPPVIAVDTVKGAYGYVIPWEGVQSAKVLGKLLQQGVKVRYAELPFEIDHRAFPAGSLIIVKTGNQSLSFPLANIVGRACTAEGVQPYPVSTGFVDKGYDFGSSRIHPLRAPRIVLLTGENVSSTAAGEIWYFFEQQLDYPVTLVNAGDMERINWSRTDIIIMPDGNYSLLKDKPFTEQLKDWINRGGKVIALERAVAQLAGADLGIVLKKEAEKEKKAEDKVDDQERYKMLKSYENRDRDNIRNINTGAIYKVTLDHSHPLAFGYPEYYYTLKQDDNLYEFLEEGGWNVGIIRKEDQVSGFVGSALKERLKDGLLFGSLDIGKGNVVMLADDPLFRNFWENGKLLFCNAVFLVGK